MLIHSRKGSHTNMLIRCIYHMFIHFIRHNKCIISDCQFTDCHQLIPAKNFSARVRWITDDDRFCAIPKSLFYQRNIELILRRNQRNINGIGSGKNRICTIIFIKRRKYHHLVTGITDCHHGTHHSFRSTTGNNDFFIGIDRPVNCFSLLLRQCLPEIRRTKGYRILMRSLIRRLRKRIHYFFRWIKVRKSLG